MTPLTDVAVLGDGPYAQALFVHAAPIAPLILHRGPHAAAPILAVFGDPDAASIHSALAAGKIVVTPPDPGLDLADGPGRLIAGGPLTHGPAARHAVARIADPAFGRVTSIYLAIRQARGPGDVLADLLPEALAFVLAALPDEITSIRVNAAPLFGPDRDAAVILLRTAADAVVTIELARCLPATLPSPGLGDIDIDVVGTSQTLRLTPNDKSVRIHRDTGLANRPWLDPAPLALLRTALDPATPDSRPATRRLRAALARVRALG